MHLPTDEEWTKLQNYLMAEGYSYDGVAGNNKIAKSLAMNSGWQTSSNSGAVGNSDYPEYRNITGFSAMPSGFRAFTGEFVNENQESYWWSATEGNNDIFGNLNLKFDSAKMYTFHDNKKYGFSVRCIKD